MGGEEKRKSGWVAALDAELDIDTPTAGEMPLTQEEVAQIVAALAECQSLAESIVRQMDVNLSLLEASRLDVSTAVEILRESNQRSEMRLAKAA